MRPHLLQAFLCVSCLTVARGATAQPQARVALDATLGLGRSVASGVTHPSGLAADVVVAFRFSASPGHAPLLAASAGRIGPSGAEVLTCTPNACATSAARFRTMALQGGWELLRESGASARALVGLAWLRNRTNQDSRSRGLAARVDLSTAALGPLALVAALQLTHHEPSAGATERLWSATAGLRVRSRSTRRAP